jgi:DnaJ-class molecular chaperone
MNTKQKKWTNRTCDSCSGHGQVSAYSFGGGDFEGPDECKDCNGTGMIWRSPNGALAQYPGGPFVGKEAT